MKRRPQPEKARIFGGSEASPAFRRVFDGLVKSTSETGQRPAEDYLFTKGNMVKEFENATRELEIGSTAASWSQFGYHIIYRAH